MQMPTHRGKLLNTVRTIPLKLSFYALFACRPPQSIWESGTDQDGAHVVGYGRKICNLDDMSGCSYLKSSVMSIQSVHGGVSVRNMLRIDNERQWHSQCHLFISHSIVLCSAPCFLCWFSFLCFPFCVGPLFCVWFGWNRIIFWLSGLSEKKRKGIQLDKEVPSQGMSAAPKLTYKAKLKHNHKNHSRSTNRTWRC